MPKDNRFTKKLTKQFLSINSLIESYFNSLNLFLQNLKKRKFINNNKVFLTFAILLILALSYFSLPTLFDKKKFVNRPRNMSLSNKKLKKIFKKYSYKLKIDYQLNMFFKDYKY